MMPRDVVGVHRPAAMRVACSDGKGICQRGSSNLVPVVTVWSISSAPAVGSDRTGKKEGEELRWLS